MKTKFYFLLWDLHSNLEDSIRKWLNRVESGSSIFRSIADKIETDDIIEQYHIYKFGSSHNS